MRWLILWMATVAIAFGQRDNFSGTAFDLETGRTHVISGSVDNSPRVRQDSFESMQLQFEMERQTYELRKQTRLLKDLAERENPAPTSYAGQADDASLEGQHYRAVLLAKYSVNFDTKEIRRLVSMPKGLLTNEIVTERLLASYDGDFTGYKWRSEEVDPQTYLVFCEMTLDGKMHDFKFKVNTEVRSCRYEGGTALSKLAPTQTKRTVTFLDEEKPPVTQQEVLGVKLPSSPPPRTAED